LTENFGDVAISFGWRKAQAAKKIIASLGAPEVVPPFKVKLAIPSALLFPRC
jgi:hypothetical protein